MLHGSARMPLQSRAELHVPNENAGTLAQRYGRSRTTVTRWRSRTPTTDAPIGPVEPTSKVFLENYI